MHFDHLSANCVQCVDTVEIFYEKRGFGRWSNDQHIHFDHLSADCGLCIDTVEILNEKQFPAFEWFNAQNKVETRNNLVRSNK